MTVPSPRLRLDTFAHLSTGHVTREVAQTLDMTELESAPGWRQCLPILHRDYGWFVFVPELEHVDPQEYAPFPDCLRACFDLARNDGASWILFDQAEQEIEALPYYEW